MRLLTRFLFSLSLMIVAGQSFSAQWSVPTDFELKMLPPFCTAKLKNDAALIQIYEPEVGPQFANIHHYCFALNFLNRFYTDSNRDEARSYLAFALNDFNYMTQHLYPGNKSLTAEIYLNQGIAESLQGKDADAIRDLQKAIELNPRLDNAYATQAKFFADRHEPAQALKIVSQGLRYTPESKRLKRLYLKFGGKLPYPKPIDQEEPKQTVESQETGSTPTQPAPDEEKQKIGSPSNPWCRFCPD